MTRKTLTTKEFIEKAKKVYGDRYDYSKLKYKNSKKEITIICKKHGMFRQRAASHLTGRGCKKCGIEQRSKKRALTKDIVIKKSKIIHKNKYNYSRIKEYTNNSVKVEIICNEHGIFRQTIGSHLNGNGCPNCSIDRATKTTVDFIKDAKRIHKDKYDYSNVEYKKNNEKVIITCKIHGNFEQSPSCHLDGCGCPHCKFKNEGKVKNILLQYFGNWIIIPNKKIWDSYKNYNHKRYCDFWLEKDGVKIIVEYDGELHFKPVCFNGMSLEDAEKNFEKYRLKDKLDKQFCEENNIILHRVRHDEDKKRSINKLLEILDGRRKYAQT